MFDTRPFAISKILSKNDTGETGGHQAGMHIRKKEEILSFFPKLDKSIKNPRHKISFKDELNIKWPFSFIYYNNKFFGGTRNEFRLTGMTKYINSNNLKSGDKINLRHDGSGSYYISHTFKNEPKENSDVIVLGSDWVVVKI